MNVSEQRQSEQRKPDNQAADKKSGTENQAADKKSGTENQSAGKKSGSFLPGVQAIGWGFVLLVLAFYFIWFCVEMSGHAVSGSAPLICIFGAAIAGSAAAGIAFATHRGRN